MNIYTHYSQYKDAGRTNEIKENWDSSEYRVPGKSFRMPFWTCVIWLESPGLQ